MFAAGAAGIGGSDIPEGLTGERVSDAPPDVIDIAGLSTRRSDGCPSLTGLLPLADESSLTRGRVTFGRMSSKSVSFTCTVSPSCNPSSRSSRNDLARSADKDIFERSEPLLPKDVVEADAVGSENTCVRESPWPELPTSIEGLRRSEPVDNCLENGASFPGAV